MRLEFDLPEAELDVASSAPVTHSVVACGWLRLLCGLKGQLLHPPVQQLSSIQNVFRPASYVGHADFSAMWLAFHCR